MPSKNAILYALAFINFVHIVDSMLIMPMGDIFIREFGLSASEFSLLVAAYALSASFSGILAIFFLDTFDRKNALLILFTGFSLGTLLCSFADSYAMLLALRVLTGFFGGIIGALVLSIISDLFPFKERGKAMGIYMMAFSAAAALGVPIGLFLAASGNWELPFVVIGTSGLIMSVAIYFLFPSMRGHLVYIEKKRSFENTILAIVKDPNQRNALIAGFVLVFGHFLIIPFISPYMIKNVGLSQLDISYQFFAGGIATVFSSIYLGRLVDRVGVMPVFVALVLISAIPTILITHTGPVPFWLAVGYTTFFFVFASGRFIPPNTIVTASAPVESRGSFMSMKSSLQQFAIAMASGLSGMIVVINDEGTFSNYNYVGYLSIIVVLFSIVLIRRIKVADGN